MKLNTQITSISAKPDGSLRYSSVTPELTNTEKTTFFSYQNKNMDTSHEPMDEAPDNMKVKSDLKPKTFAKEMRDYCYVYCKEMGIDFEQSWEAYKEKQRTNWRRKLDELKAN